MAHQGTLTTVERLAGTPRLPLRSVAFGAAGVALALGHGVTLLEKSHQPKDPEVLLHEHPGDRAIIVVPGCRTDGRVIADMLEPQLGQLGTTAFIVNPTNGFSEKAIGQSLLQAREQSGKKQVSLCLLSFAGMVAVRLGEDESFRQAFGPIDKMVFDSSPARKQDIRPKLRHVLEATRNPLVRYSYAADKVLPLIMTHVGRDKFGEHEAGVDDALVRRHFESTARAHPYTIASQGDFMRQQKGLPAGTLRGWANELYYVHAPYDPVVDTDASVLAYSEMFGQPIHDVIDTSRPHSSHAAWPEYPSGIVSLLARSSPVIPHAAQAA